MRSTAGLFEKPFQEAPGGSGSVGEGRKGADGASRARSIPPAPVTPYWTLLWGHSCPSPSGLSYTPQQPENVSSRVRREAFWSAPSEVVRAQGLWTGPASLSVPPHLPGGERKARTVEGQAHDDTVYWRQPWVHPGPPAAALARGTLLPMSTSAHWGTLLGRQLPRPVTASPPPLQAARMLGLSTCSVLPLCRTPRLWTMENTAPASEERLMPRS